MTSFRCPRCGLVGLRYLVRGLCPSCARAQKAQAERLLKENHELRAENKRLRLKVSRLLGVVQDAEQKLAGRDPKWAQRSKVVRESTDGFC